MRQHITIYWYVFGKAEPIEQVEPENEASPEIQRELSEDENQEKEVNNE